jgi:hypothetical protein
MDFLSVVSHSALGASVDENPIRRFSTGENNFRIAGLTNLGEALAWLKLNTRVVHTALSIDY